MLYCTIMYWGADKSLARPGKKEAQKHVRTRAISTTSRRELSSSYFFLQGKAPKEIHAILTETLACFLSGRAKDFSALLYNPPSHGALTPSVPSGLQAVPYKARRRRKFTPF